MEQFDSTDEALALVPAVAWHILSFTIEELKISADWTICRS
jgi:hypothetical protein